MADAAVASPILGALFGAGSRLVPEVLNFFDRKNRRKHELDLGTQQLELVKAQGATHLAEIDAQAVADGTTKSIDALRAVLEAQARPVGIKWVDALSAIVRPVWTLSVLLSWLTVRIVNMIVALVQGLDWPTVQPMVWNGDDVTMMTTLMAFWFMSRTLEKKNA